MARRWSVIGSVTRGSDELIDESIANRAEPCKRRRGFYVSLFTTEGTRDGWIATRRVYGRRRAARAAPERAVRAGAHCRLGRRYAALHSGGRPAGAGARGLLGGVRGLLPAAQGLLTRVSERAGASGSTRPCRGTFATA